MLEMDLKGRSEQVVKHAVAKAYRDGYDRLEITHKDRKVLEAIQEAANELLGYAIMEQDEQRCVVQTITREVDLTFEESLDEIDDVLETNAEEFVKNYVQKGGQ